MVEVVCLAPAGARVSQGTSEGNGAANNIIKQTSQYYFSGVKTKIITVPKPHSNYMTTIIIYYNFKMYLYFVVQIIYIHIQIYIGKKEKHRKRK